MRRIGFWTRLRFGQHAWLDARHRAHARVEDRIRCDKDTGLTRLPSKRFAINQAWLACVLTAIDLITWTQTILLHDDPDLARAEPKTLGSLLLHVAAHLVHGGRRLRLKIDKTWRWAPALACEFHRLAALPTPLTCPPLIPTKITDNPDPSPANNDAQTATTKRRRSTRPKKIIFTIDSNKQG